MNFEDDDHCMIVILKGKLLEMNALEANTRGDDQFGG